jgi:hypothetical protein
LILMAAYAATLGLHAGGASRYSAAEAHRLLVADSIVHDRDLDVANQYRSRAYADWYPGTLRPAGKRVAGRLLEPAGIGTPLLIAAAYAIGGPTAVELWCAALLALAFVFGTALARRVVPEPWATRATLLCGLSPPALAAATTIAPEAAAAALATGAALLALRVRERPSLRWTSWSATLLAPLPWLSLRAVPVGAVVALALFRWLRRRQRALAGFVALEVLLIGAVVYVTLNDRLFGGLTPAAARRAPGPPTGADSLSDYAGRIPRLLTALVDPHHGLLRWAPLFALAGVGLLLLWRSQRDRLAVIASDQVDVEVAAGLCGLIAAVALAVTAFAQPTLGDVWLVSPDLVVALPAAAALVAWGLRFAPRAGALLATVTLLESAWLLLRL